MKNFMVFIIMISMNANAQYNRKDWKHWSDFDKNCQNTRAEVLISRSLKPVTFKGNKKCTVSTGLWDDYYYNEKLDKASKVDIDHLIPLKHAYESGGLEWSRQKKEQFSNDPENLVITNLKYNRTKGAKTILEWLPIDRKYACKYVSDWFYVKNKYQLKVTKEEKSVKNNLKCEKK